MIQKQQRFTDAEIAEAERLTRQRARERQLERDYPAMIEQRQAEKKRARAEAALEQALGEFAAQRPGYDRALQELQQEALKVYQDYQNLKRRYRSFIRGPREQLIERARAIGAARHRLDGRSAIGHAQQVFKDAGITGGLGPLVELPIPNDREGDTFVAALNSVV